MAKYKPAKRKYGNKYLAFKPLCGVHINIVLLLAGKVNHQHIGRIILQVHGYILMLQVLV